MILRFFYIFSFLLASVLYTRGQSDVLSSIGGLVKDYQGNKLPAATVYVEGATKYTTVSDSNGFYKLYLPAGKYNIAAQHIGYTLIVKSFDLKADEHIRYNINLVIDDKQLSEVFVTASEAKGLTSTSVISKEAMRLLQPSSFADLMELLPGGRARTPVLTSVNPVRLRQAGSPSSNYDISSLGTGFYIDGAPINTNANIQTTSGFSSPQDQNSTRDMTNKGVDMRSIPTDQIEKVEIIRGIPSVEYGDITSGAILITRKTGYQPITARMKADGFSKLYSIGKGFYDKKNKLSFNFDVDFLNALSDPTSNYTNYQRFTTSLRTQKEWNKTNGVLKWQGAFDYAHNIDNVKPDPENSLAGIDKYSSLYNRYGLRNQLTFSFNKNSRFFRNVDLLTNLGYEQDKINLTKFMQARTATILVTSLEQGAFDANFLTPSYIGNLVVDGKPFTGFAKLSSAAEYKTGNIRHKLKLGTEFNYSKNFGLGQVYDLNYPIDLSGSVQVGATTRPRAFKDIPAMQQLSFYAENIADFNLLKQHFTVATGVRGFTTLGLDQRYYVAGKYYLDPRVNFKWAIPSFYINNKALQIALGGGFGMLTKTPTLSHLYPPKHYIDLVQLNYYHNNAAFRTANAMTYIIDNTNFNLRHATNKKWEANLDFNYDGYRLAVTYFKERNFDGFREASRYSVLRYKRYDNTSINHDTITVKPRVQDFAYTDIAEYYGYGMTTNGSKLIKEGIEYQFTTKRMAFINTRFTLNGAWFRTTYMNSNALYKIISTSVVTNGKYRQYIGLYDDDEGTYNEQFNTNLTIDSRIPSLGLNVATSFQCRWLTSSQSAFKTGTPVAYMGIDEVMHPYTEESKKDKDLQWLNDPIPESYFKKSTVPTDMQVNLKISKGFLSNKAVVSMFVNRIFVYTPNYYNQNDVYIVRKGLNNTPYFGMELNFNF